MPPCGAGIRSNRTDEDLRNEQQEKDPERMSADRVRDDREGCDSPAGIPTVSAGRPNRRVSHLTLASSLMALRK